MQEVRSLLSGRCCLRVTNKPSRRHKEDSVSSTYLTSADINLIERLLGEVQERGPVQTLNEVTAAARLLIRRMESGLKSETALRGALAHYVGLRLIMDEAVSRWDGEGGAAGSGVRS
jgi:hypothetical protein